MNKEQNNLKICVNDKKKEIFIPQESLFLNTLVLGNKGTGKTTLLLREYAYQIIADKNKGGTFIVSSRDLSYELYILAKHYKRRVIFINPAVSNDVDIILTKGFVSKKEFKGVCNFEKLIYNNYIVIIDMETVRTREIGKNAVNCLLESFSDSMYKTEITYSKQHFLYVDDAFNYLKALEPILYYGSEFNIATTLFFQNRNQFKLGDNDYSDFLDSNIGNVILTNSLNLSDAKFYGEILDINLVAYSKSKGKIFYILKNKDGARFSGCGEVKDSETFKNIVYEELYPVKRALKRKKIKEQNKYLSEQQHDDNKDTNSNVDILERELEKEVFDNNVDNSSIGDNLDKNIIDNIVDFNANNDIDDNMDNDINSNIDDNMDNDINSNIDDNMDNDINNNIDDNVDNDINNSIDDVVDFDINDINFNIDDDIDFNSIDFNIDIDVKDIMSENNNIDDVIFSDKNKDVSFVSETIENGKIELTFDWDDDF